MQRAWQASFVEGAPSIERAVRGITRKEAGAIAVLSPTARDVGLRVTPIRGSKTTLGKALKAGKAQGAFAGRILHGTGRIAAGKPMVVVAACARSRQDALLSVQAMLNTLKGVARRQNESKA